MPRGAQILPGVRKRLSRHANDRRELLLYATTGDIAARRQQTDSSCCLRRRGRSSATALRVRAVGWRSAATFSTRQRAYGEQDIWKSTAVSIMYDALSRAANHSRVRRCALASRLRVMPVSGSYAAAERCRAERACTARERRSRRSASDIIHDHKPLRQAQVILRRRTLNVPLVRARYAAGSVRQPPRPTSESNRSVACCQAKTKETNVATMREIVSSAAAVVASTQTQRRR